MPALWEHHYRYLEVSKVLLSGTGAKAVNQDVKVRGPDVMANPVAASDAERTRIDSLVTVSQGRRVPLDAKLKGKVGNWLCLLVVSAATFRAARNKVEDLSPSEVRRRHLSVLELRTRLEGFVILLCSVVLR